MTNETNETNEFVIEAPKIKVKKLHPDAVLPRRATDTDAGYDLVAIDDGVATDNYIEYKTGIAIEPPKGYHTEIIPRSSITKKGLMLKNSIGLIDNGFRGEIAFRFKDTGEGTHYHKGDKIGQVLIRKTISMDFEFADELSSTVRGEGGFGSTGK